MAVLPIDFHRFKLLSSLEGPGKDILTFILKSGTRSPTSLPGVRLDEYIYNLPSDSTSSYVLSGQSKKKKKPFNPSEMNQIIKYPLWDNFDITLLYKAIRLACEDVAKENDEKWKNQNEMEGLINEIKNERNIAIHEMEPMTEKQFEDKLDELRNLFLKTLKAAKARYNVSDEKFAEMKDKILQDTSKMKQTEVDMLKGSFKTMLRLFVHESQKRLRSIYVQAQYFDPLSFLSGSPQGEVHIQSIFCKVLLTEHGRSRDLDMNNILALARSMKQNPVSIVSSNEESSEFCNGNEASEVSDKEPSASFEPEPFARPQLVMVTGVAGSGKTTLLTFILSEWLKDFKECCIEHLSEYDIVLRILCRERDGPSLEEFLKQVLPYFFTMVKDHLVSLLRECKVLFLIDGVDELSRDSPTYQLVINILNAGKDVAGFTIICTSRPETAEDFMDEVPESYLQWKVNMKGVSREDRCEFVLKHYESLPPHKTKDSERLKSLVKRISWRDYFELPINLLFVATLFYTEPDCLKDNPTQILLYSTINEWCVQKLQRRLAGKSDVERDRQLREDGINRVLEVINKVSLESLLEDRLSLSENEVHEVRESCKAQKLPSVEVMGAFLCLRETIVRLVPRKKYSAPHKSIQEFYAAKDIVHDLVKDNTIESRLQEVKKRLKKEVHKLMKGPSVGSIQYYLKKPSSDQLKKLKNLLVHLVGLLSQPDIPEMPQAIEEVIDLLAQTSSEKYKFNEWLKMLQDTEVNQTALEAVCKHIKQDAAEEVIVKDSTFHCASAILPMSPSKRVKIVVSRRESNVCELVHSGIQHTYTMLYLEEHYRNPSQPGTSDEFLYSLPRQYLEFFKGHLSPEAIMELQGCHHMEFLYLAVRNNEETPAILSSIDKCRRALPTDMIFNLHIPVNAVGPESLTTPLPDMTLRISRTTLALSGVDETMVERIAKVVIALQPRKGYFCIQFPGCSLKADVWGCIIKELGQAGAKVCRSLFVPENSPIGDAEESELNCIAETWKLGGFKRVRTVW